MSHLLYRNGTKDRIWGIDCEYKQFADEDVDAAIADGWVDHPHKLPKESAVKEVNDLIEDAVFEEVKPKKRRTKKAK